MKTVVTFFLLLLALASVVRAEQGKFEVGLQDFDEIIQSEVQH